MAIAYTRGDIGGLNQDSVVLCEQIRVVDKSRVMRILGHLDENYMIDLRFALCAILGL